MKKNNHTKIMMMLFYVISSLVILSVTGCASNPSEDSPEFKRAEIYFQQGTQELINKNYTEALGHLLEAKKLAPENDQIRNNLGMAYYLKKQNEKARIEFEKALSINPKNSDARNNYASILFELKKYEQAKKEYETVLADLTYTKNFRVYYNLGLIYSNDNKIEEAKEFFQKSITENPDYCPAKYQYGKIFVDQYKFKDALAAFQEAVKGVCVNEPASHLEMGRTLTYLHRRPEAEKKFKEVIEKFAKSSFATLAREELAKIEDEKRIEARAEKEIRTKSSDVDSTEAHTEAF